MNKYNISTEEYIAITNRVMKEGEKIGNTKVYFNNSENIQSLNIELVDYEPTDISYRIDSYIEDSGYKDPYYIETVILEPGDKGVIYDYEDFIEYACEAIDNHINKLRTFKHNGYLVEYSRDMLISINGIETVDRLGDYPKEDIESYPWYIKYAAKHEPTQEEIDYHKMGRKETDKGYIYTWDWEND